MADLPTDFWSGWIAIITVVSLCGLGWLIFNIYFPSGKPEETTTHVWDETLQEGINPPPMWWFWMILILLTVTVGYLVLYPGLGSYRGVLEWSQGRQLDDSVARHEEKYRAVQQGWLKTPLDKLGSDEEAMRTGARIFKNYCAGCHGADARGQASHFPDLTDKEWQWGATPEQIKTSIMNGRSGVMPPWGPTLGDEGVLNVTEYVFQLGGRQVNEDATRVGEEKFKQLCVACHGVEGKGNPALGAPDLTNNIWLYGGSESAVMKSIAEGHQGQMPAHKDSLGDARVHLLAAYVYSLSQQN